MTSSTPWQLRMFQKTLKKKLRLREFEKYLGKIPAEKRCLLVTCGDNNGAINYYLRALGGNWSFADVEDTALAEMSALLGTEVMHAPGAKLAFPDAIFNIAIAIDVHEHLPDPAAFTAELQRVTRPGGRVLVTVPVGDPYKIVNLIKNRIGMTKEKYGHYRDGFSIIELQEMMRASGIRPRRTSSFSRLFTELIELGINFLYVNVLSKKNASAVKEGTIAPQTEDQLKSVEKTYRLYRLVYPFFWAFSQLDRLLFFSEGYVVVVEGEKGLVT